jgi:AAA15 family ATPase/GTPase
MSILFNELESKNCDYVNSKINKNLLIVLDWFNKSIALYKGRDLEKSFISAPYGFLANLEKGTIEEKKYKELQSFEKLLNTFFTQLYSDIKKVYYKITPDEKNIEKYELFVQKNIYDALVDIPFELESSGTHNLLEMVPYLFSALRGGTVLIDELDRGLHDLLVIEIIKLFQESLVETINGQFIATTHNTSLMKLFSNEAIYIITADAKGNKEIVTVDDYSSHTKKNNYAQNKYLNGNYSGIPYVGNLDFTEILEDLENSLDKNF